MPAVISLWCRKNGVKLKRHQMEKQSGISPVALSFQNRGVDFWLCDAPWHVVNPYHVIRLSNREWLFYTSWCHSFHHSLEFQNFYVEFQLLGSFRCSLFASFCFSRLPHWRGQGKKCTKTSLCTFEHMCFWLSTEKIDLLSEEQAEGCVQGARSANLFSS